ncbi:MAG: hypothetical protein HXX18_11540 [Bacteroidetes bacterium]|nr:hypothetical protein [Bacteroidota bacterium]
MCNTRQLTMNLDRIQPRPKTGQEQLIYNEKPLGFSVLDFWRWSTSDILANTIRGGFAEFIVATATNIDLTVLRDEWSAYDLKTPEGIKLEIKSSAFIQSWFQRTLSAISFSTKPALYWDSFTNKQADIKQRHADVYVFCLLHHTEKLTIDPLNINHWEFYVLATQQLNEYKRSQHSITLKSLRGLISVVPYDKLKETIIDRHKLNKKQ